MIWTHEHASPVGTLGLESDGEALTRIWLPTEHRRAVGGERRADPAPFTAAVRQLEAWFAGTRRSFDLPLAPGGTPFHSEVWDLVAAIPWGEITTYGALARRLGRPSAMRAVGAANGRNPLPLVVPCHRVIGADGHLTGYAGGLPLKRTLLEREGLSVEPGGGGRVRMATDAREPPRVGARS